MIVKKDIAYERFFAAEGELLDECDSQRLLMANMEDNYRFAHFKNSTDKIESLFVLFQHVEKDIVASCEIASCIVGEWFVRIDLGRDVKVGKNVNLLAHGGISLKRGVILGDNVQFITVGHGLHPSQRHLIRCAPIIVEEGACIGEGAIIINASLDGQAVVIGKGAQILPWSVVISDVMPCCIVGGRPAKAVQALNRGEHLSEHYDISHCLKISSVHSAQNELTQELFIIPPIFIQNPENIFIGKNAFFNRNAIIKAQGVVRIGDNVLYAPSAVIHADFTSIISIGNDVWVGAGACVVAQDEQDLRIGSGSILAAGATVTKNVPDMTIVVGNNRHVRKIDDSFLKHIPDFTEGGCQP